MKKYLLVLGLLLGAQTTQPKLSGGVKATYKNGQWDFTPGLQYSIDLGDVFDHVKEGIKANIKSIKGKRLSEEEQNARYYFNRNMLALIAVITAYKYRKQLESGAKSLPSKIQSLWKNRQGPGHTTGGSNISNPAAAAQKRAQQ